MSQMDLPNLIMNAMDRLGDYSPYVNVVDRYLHQQSLIRNDGQRRDWRGILHTLLILPEPLLIMESETHWMCVEAALITEHSGGQVIVLHCSRKEGAREQWEYELESGD
jgi:hypothetical protein